METLKVFSVLFILAAAYLFVGDDDYHKKFDKPSVVRYNCDMLIGGWHPDVPREVIDKCRKSERDHVNIKTYKEEPNR
jgi:hypothetical protein